MPWKDAVADADVAAAALAEAEGDCTACRKHMSRVLRQQLILQLQRLRAAEMEAGEKLAIATHDHGRRVAESSYIAAALNSGQDLTPG